MTARLRAWARQIKSDLVVLFYAARDERTPWYARLIAVLVVAYALSPVDLIPDVVPVLGLVDDLLIVPLGLLLAARLIPADVLEDHRRRVNQSERLPRNRIAGLVVVALWLMAAVAVGWWVWRTLPAW